MKPNTKLIIRCEESTRRGSIYFQQSKKLSKVIIDPGLIQVKFMQFGFILPKMKPIRRTHQSVLLELIHQVYRNALPDKYASIWLVHS